jgi:hypothetical protein
MPSFPSLYNVDSQGSDSREQHQYHSWSYRIVLIRRELTALRQQEPVATEIDFQINEKMFPPNHLLAERARAASTRIDRGYQRELGCSTTRLSTDRSHQAQSSAVERHWGIRSSGSAEKSKGSRSRHTPKDFARRYPSFREVAGNVSRV